MSRWTSLFGNDVAAVCGMARGSALRIVKRLDKSHWRFNQGYGRGAHVTAGQLAAYYEEQKAPLPPLLIALINDEREYPAWLVELRNEFSAARKLKKLNFRKKKQARVTVARTHEEVVAVMTSLPDIEARGYIEDEGLPPEYYMDDRLGLARADEDDDG